MRAMASGYLYVLANSSMPGLVKIGKTTRLPSERAVELSGVTGVATPFIVVYEDYFDDCDAAESFVHTKLAAIGLRLADNRECFRASVSDVVKTIVAIPSGLSARPSAPDELLTPDGSEFDDFALEVDCPSHPWDALMEEADRYYYGSEDYIEDEAEALRLFRDAARLGSPMAFERIGDMYRSGRGVREDPQKALEFYKEGAKKGNYRCYEGMTCHFLCNRHLENARKSLRRMIDGGLADRWKTYVQFPDQHIVSIANLLVTCFISLQVADSQMISIVDEYLPEVIDHLRADIDSGNQSNSRVNQEKIQLISILQAWINVHPIPPPTLP